MRYRIFRNNCFVATKYTESGEWLEAMQQIEADATLVASDIVYVSDFYYIVELDPLFGVKLVSASLDEDTRKALYRQAYAADRAAVGASK